MRLSSLSEIDNAGVRLEDVLSADVPLRALLDHWGCAAETLQREGLGDFDVLVLHSKDIGFWAAMGSPADPEVGTSVWAEPGVSDTDLAAAVRQSLAPLKCRLIRARTGRIVE